MRSFPQTLEKMGYRGSMTMAPTGTHGATLNELSLPGTPSDATPCFSGEFMQWQPWLIHPSSSPPADVQANPSASPSSVVVGFLKDHKEGMNSFTLA